MCLLFALWFASGIVMMYVEYPELTEKERLENLPSLDLSKVSISPWEASKATEFANSVEQVKLTTVLDRPAYEFRSLNRYTQIIFADSGEPLSEINEAIALSAARGSGFTTQRASPRHEGLKEVDQWTLTASLDRHRPLHKIALQDEANTVLYVSSVTAQVVRDTNGAERFWNLLGSTIHWIYPTILRKNAALWNDVIVYLSLVGIVSVITGAIIGFMRLGVRKRFRNNRMTPYQGWMKWHHVGGLFTLVFVSTYIFSGLMSMGPWGVFDSNTTLSEQVSRYAGNDILRLSTLSVPSSDITTANIKEIQWHQILGKTYFSIIESSDSRRAFFEIEQSSDKDRLDFEIRNAIPQLLPESKLISVELLTNEDDYYYSRHNRYRPLPVYRAKFDDLDNSWFHIDGTNGQVLNRVDNASRRERWLYNSLHSLDFQFLIQRRPLWDIVVIFLNTLGFGFSLTAVVIGWRHIKQLLSKNLKTAT